MAHRSRSTKFMATSLSLALVASATASAVTLRSAAIFWRDRGQQQREAVRELKEWDFEEKERACKACKGRRLLVHAGRRSPPRPRGSEAAAKWQ